MASNAAPGPRILILGDSISLPRLETPYDETWIGRLKKYNPSFDVIDKCERGASSFKLVTAGGGGIDTLELYAPDIAIIQMGVTESAPRLFRKQGLEHFFLNSILPRRYRPRYIARVKKRRVRSPEKADTPPESFREHIKAYCRRAALIQTRVILTVIAPPSSNLKIKSPLFEDSIFLYNSILKEAAGAHENVFLFDPYSSIDDLENSWLDEIHFNSRIHHAVYMRMEDLLRELLG